MDVRIDQEFKSLIPTISQDEYSQLEGNVLKDGCRDPLVLWQNILLDGHNRYEICTKYGLPFKTVEMSFEGRDEAKEWIILNQFGRRNLLLYDRGLLGIKLDALKKKIVARAKERQRGGQGGVLLLPTLAEAKIDTRKEIAKIAGVSEGTISKVETIEQKNGRC